MGIYWGYYMDILGPSYRYFGNIMGYYQDVMDTLWG